MFALRQARDIGFTVAAVRHQLRTGRWQPVRNGVYRIAGSQPSWEQSLMSVVLAAGPHAVASHSSAAALLGIPGFRRGEGTEITTLRGQRHRPPDGIVHRSGVLPASHLSVVTGIPATNAARTLVDLAGVLPPGRTERAVDNCLSIGLVTRSQLRAVTAHLARPGQSGPALMRRLLDERGDGYIAPASELEARFLAVVRAADLAPPIRQHNVGDSRGWVGRVDFAYPDLRLLVELDSRRHHMAKLDFEADRARDNRSVAAGWRPLRVTWQAVTSRPAEVVDLLRSAGVTEGRPGDTNRPRLREY